MLIQQLNRTDPEVVKIVVKNVDGAGSITTGNGVCLVQAGASIDGVSAVNSTAAAWEGFCGVADQDIAINGFGLVVAWGIANSVYVSHVGTSITITAGDFLKPGGLNGSFFSSITDQAVSTLFYRYVIAATTPAAVSTLAQSFCKGIVRAI
jgi:hypothetical protein